MFCNTRIQKNPSTILVVDIHMVLLLRHHEHPIPSQYLWSSVKPLAEKAQYKRCLSHQQTQSTLLNDELTHNAP